MKYENKVFQVQKVNFLLMDDRENSAGMKTLNYRIFFNITS